MDHLTASTDPRSASMCVVAVAVLAITAYLWGAMRQRRLPWPPARTVAFLTGTVIATGTILVVLDDPHLDYPSHMVAHLLVGMVAPLFLVVGAPVTLMLRSLHLDAARRLSRLLRARVTAVLSHPVPAGVLDIGGLWLIYTTGVYTASHEAVIVLLGVQLHLLLAGYLFTAGIVGIDPAPHRAGYGVRATVLVAAFAAHGILAKHLVGHPPAGVDPLTAETGGMVMYYGGDLVEVALLVMLGGRWYTSVRPRPRGRRTPTADAAQP